MSITVSTFYKFATIDDPDALKTEVSARACSLGIKGTILIAHEGINATISGNTAGIAALLEWLRADDRFRNMEDKQSLASAHPFRRLKVKVKPEIVTFGHPDIDPSQNAGTYVPPERWNALIQDPDVVVIDTRNAYEVGIGTFQGAIDPQTETFQDFAKFADATLNTSKHRKIAMFCTGGIRCEKATAYLRARGFSDVYHLQGGILKYLKVVPKSESLWQGACYIFDDRVALEHGVTPGNYRHCRRCGYPVYANAEALSALPCAKCAES